MKKILFVMICSFCLCVQAQELFPELAGLGNRKAKVSETSIEEANPEASNVVEQLDDSVEAQGEEKDEKEADLFASKTPTETEDKTEDEGEGEEVEEEDDPEQRITVYMKDIRGTITPNKGFSYCYGLLKFVNTMKAPVDLLQIVLKYDGWDTKYSVKNLVPNVEQEGTIGLIGEPCEHIADMPEITIERCVIQGMPEKKCKTKFEFIPLRGAS